MVAHVYLRSWNLIWGSPARLRVGLKLRYMRLLEFVGVPVVEVKMYSVSLYPYLPSSIAPECLYSLLREFYAATFTVLGFLFNSPDASLRHRASYLQRVSLKIGPL